MQNAFGFGIAHVFTAKMRYAGIGWKLEIPTKTPFMTRNLIFC